MKNLIKVLLYSLLGLLVVAIAVMIYRRSKAEPLVSENLAEPVDSLSADQGLVGLTGPLTKDDSMILDLTGEVPTQIGPSLGSTPDLDYSKPVNSSPITNTSSQANPQSVATTNQPASAGAGDIVALPKLGSSSSSAASTNAANSNTEIATKAAPKTITTAPKLSTPTAPKTVSNHTTTKSATKQEKKSVAKESMSTAKATTAKAKFYVVAGSYIVPNGADAQVKKLKKLGFVNAVRKAFGNEEYYRAVAGSYGTRNEAEYAVKKLKAKGVDAFIKQ